MASRARPGMLDLLIRSANLINNIQVIKLNVACPPISGGWGEGFYKTEFRLTYY